MSETILQVERLTKRYHGNAVVDDISFQINRGETLCLLGPSGCGKSTTLRMIAGIDIPDEGKIRIAGETVASASDGVFVASEKRNIGLVFQSYAIWPHLSVEKNISYPLEVRRTPKSIIDEKVREVLEIVGLSGFGKRSATQLSGGQQQRVALARALVYSPRLLLLDEPLSNLDARLRDELRNEIKRIQRQLALTVLYVTHDQVEAMTLADRIAVMHQGRIMQLGTPFEVYDAPKSLFVQDFFGKSYMFEGVLRVNSGAPEMRLDGGLTFKLWSADGMADGSRINASIRAEDIHVETTGAHSPSNEIECLPAEVQEVRFLGDKFECILQIDRDRHFIECSRSLALVPGQRVSLHIPRAQIRTWPKSESGKG